MTTKGELERRIERLERAIADDPDPSGQTETAEILNDAAEGFRRVGAEFEGMGYNHTANACYGDADRIENHLNTDDSPPGESLTDICGCDMDRGDRIRVLKTVWEQKSMNSDLTAEERAAYADAAEKLKMVIAGLPWSEPP